MESCKLIVGNDDCRINDISGVICEDKIIYDIWTTFAGDLGVSQRQIEDFLQRKLLKLIPYRDVICNCLELWRGTMCDDAKLTTLIRIIEGDKIKAYDAGKTLREMFHLPLRGMENETEVSLEMENSKEPAHFDIDYDRNLTVFVTPPPPSSPMKFADDEYNLPFESKGYALILNISESDNWVRKGAEQDTSHMKELWGQLGYKVIVREGYITKADFHYAIESLKLHFARRPELARSCVVFVGGHGIGDRLVTSDGEVIHIYEDIIYQFDSKRCPELIGKPKIFLFQACKDYDTDSEPRPEPSIDDAIVGFATIPGYLAKRADDIGSWYIYCLTKVLMENAHKMDLESMLKKTRTEMGSLPRAQKFGQMSTFLYFGLKKLYFNLPSRK